MMPGETHPAAPGPADLARCQGCASLQQNLNEYVEALIALKQKIINTDNLLTEYQKKCDELQFARRENSTLHHQVEQMLQKISPLQKCQEELGSLKAELEEKKSSLKLYQDTHQEYTRVKEECLRTDAQKKKLEAKVKKLEEAAVKQTQDFKQLRNEKKILEKEFKKTQERLDEFSKQKNEKELRHIGTQISSDSHGSIDKRKVKVLLKELWLCVNTAHRLSGESSRRIPEKPAKGNSVPREPGQDDLLQVQGSPARASDMRSFFTKLSMEMEGDFTSSESAEEELPTGASPSTENAFCEERHPEVSGQRPDDSNRTDVYDHEHFFDDDLQAAIDFFKLPPPLLSPVPSPPPMASGSVPSSLAPESCFGDITDSSDSDSVPPRDSLESTLEDYTAESRGYFDLLEKIKRSDMCVEKPGPLEAAQTVNKLTPLGVVAGKTALGEPSATSSLAWGRHSTALSESVRDRGDDVEEAERQVEAREVDKSVQVGKGLRKHNRRLWLEMTSRSPAAQKEAGAGQSQVWSSPLGKRTFSELIDSEGKTLSSKTLCPSQSEFSKRILTDGFAPNSHCVTGSGHFQRRERSVQESTPQSGACAAAAGRDRSASLPSSSSATSIPVSVCSSRQTSWPGCISVGTPAEVTCTDPHHSEQKSPTRTLNTFLRSEPTAHLKENDPKNSLSTLSPKSKLGMSTFSDWKSKGLESFSIFKSTAKGHSLPQSVFQKPTGGGQCGGRGPGTTLILPKSDWTSLAHSQAGFTRRSPGSADSTSWHRSDVLRRGSGGSPRATSEYQQRAKLQLEKEAPASQNSRLTAMLGPPGERNIPLGFKTAAALLPNQVSVITKQARPKRVLSSSMEPWRLRGNTLSSAVNGSKGIGLSPSVPAYVGDGDPTAQDSEQVADEELPSPEVSVSWRKPNCDSPGGSLLTENFDCSTDRKLPFSSEDNLFQRVMNEHLLQKLRKSPQTTQPGASRLEAGELLPSGVTSGVSAEQMPHGPRHQANTEAPVAAPQNASAPLIVPSRGPLRARVPMGPVGPSGLCRADETRGNSQSSLPGASYCYTGIRERAEEDTEVEDEAVSCSEGEHEAEAVMRCRQQDAVGDSKRPSGDPEAGVGETGHPSDVGDLTSALQECNLSTILYIDKLSTSEVVMVLESCQLRDYSSGASVSECSSKGALNEEMNKELRQSEISRKKCGKRFCEEELLRASGEWAESEGDDCCGRKSCQDTQCPLEVPSDVLTKTGEELQTNPVDCGKDTEHALLVHTHHNQAATDLTENALPEETSSPVPHTAELPEPSPVGGGGSSPLSSRSDPEHIQSRDEGEPSSGGSLSTEEEGLAEPGELLTLSSDCPAPPRLEQSSECVAETAFRYQISAVTSEVISVLINKDQDLVIEEGDNWTIISGVAISPGLEQVVLCDTLGDAAPSQAQEGLDDGSMEKSPGASPSGPLPQEPPCGGDLSGAQEDVSSTGQSANFDKSRLRNRPVKPSIWIRSQIYDQTLETEKVTSDHTYYNWKLEPLCKNKPRSKISNKDQASKLTKTPGLNRGEVHLSEVSQPVSGERTNTQTPRSQAQPTTAGTDMSAPINCSPDTLSKIRQEVGPPLPPLLPPLIATPPRTSRTLSPLVPSSSPSSKSSPAGRVSPLCEVPGPPVLSPWPEELQQASPLDPSPSPSTATASGRIVSSPLQFCAATPKHALPVPGRLPSCAPGHAAVSGPQENSVKILDTMYPELSARARTLSLLKGNMQLSRGSTVDGKVLPGRVSALLGLKAITSTSTAFVLTGGSSGGDSNQGKSQDAGGKRTLAVSMLRSAKRLRLDNESPEPDTREVTGEGVPKDPQGGIPSTEVVPAEEEQTDVPVCSSAPLLRVNPREMAESYNIAITRALRKIAESSFDLLPVIRSHVYVGNISKKPVMRDQEKEVVYEFSTTNKHLGEYLLRSILSELKIQKTSLDHSYIHALCRVYVGICRQLGDLERARLFCYSLLKEDFPESEKLTLFIANMWREVFLSQSAISEAMQLVARQRARGEVLNCLRAFLSWEKNAPIDVGIVVSKLLLTIQLCPKTEFQSSEEFGEDLSANIWEYIFAIDLLCCHQRWIWTHDNIISKELWPVMDKWIKYRKGHSNIAYTPDIIVASVLRLIGRLGQLGLKEGFPTAVKNISSVIGMFIQHAQDEDIPWGVQLAAVYALCDLSPSNPAEISKILEAWRTQTSNTIPSAIVNCLEEVGSLSADGSADCPSKGDCAP